MAERRSVSVIGAGGHGKVVVSTLVAAGHPVGGIYDDNERRWGSDLLGHEVVGPIAELGDGPAVVALGDNRLRRKITTSLDLEWIAVVHPSTVVHESVRLGVGTVVFAGAIVQPETIVGDHAILNTGATIDHDCHIGDFAHLAPGCHLSGSVHIGEGALLGVGSCAIPGVTVGSWAVVGGGAAVTRDIPGGKTAVGVPAEPR